jgi:hypothetical protein
VTIVGLDPTSGPLPQATGRSARRTHSLDGAVIGLVSNGLGRSDDVMAAIAEEMGRHVQVARVVAVRKPSVSVPPDPFDWERLINEVTVAVAGFGG